MHLYVDFFIFCVFGLIFSCIKSFHDFNKWHQCLCSDPRAWPDLVGGSESKPQGRPVEVINQILLVIILLNFSFQKCRNPNPRLDPIGGSKPEPGLLRQFSIILSKHFVWFYYFRFCNYAKAFQFGQAHKHLHIQKDS